MCMSKEEKMSDDNKALVRRLFDEVFSPENLAAADEIMAKDYIESSTDGQVAQFHVRRRRRPLGYGRGLRAWRACSPRGI